MELKRRGFLAGGVAAGVWVGLGGRAGWGEGVDGAPRKLLAGTFGGLTDALLGVEAWRPYPKCGEAGWALVPEQIRTAMLARADAANSGPWPEMLATDELEFKRNGNRTRLEAKSFGRRNRLLELVLGECISGQGKYLDEIANGIWLICEETFWGVPAHLGAQKAGVGLADAAEPIIELFGAETAATLGWCVYLLEKQLRSVSPLIVERVHLEAKRRILEPYFERNDFGWMGLKESGGAHHLNNWNVWINSNVLTANLLLERDAGRRKAVVDKVCMSVDEFLADYSPDAGCEEGPGYWGRSAASFFDCCWTLISAHGGKGDEVLKHPFTRAMGHYICDVHIADRNFVNYGDAHVHDAPAPDLAYRFGKATGDAMLAKFGVFEGTRADGQKRVLTGVMVEEHGGIQSLSRTLARVMVAGEMLQAPAEDALPRDAWYPHLGLMTARQKEGSEEGFYLAAQGAGNGRSHGHNDSGSFIVFHDGQPVFIDVGPEAYTATTFSKDRYTLWPMQSAFHNLPTIGGVMQHEGVPYGASDLRYDKSDRATRLKMNLATAYAKEAGVQRWERTMTLDRGRGVVGIEEEFVLARPAEVMLSLMTAVEPVVHEGGVRVGTVEMSFDGKALSAAVEKIVVKDAGMKASWGDAVYRVRLRSAGAVSGGTWRMELRRG